MGFLVLRTEHNVNQASWLMTQKHTLIRGRKERGMFSCFKKHRYIVIKQCIENGT